MGSISGLVSPLYCLCDPCACGKSLTSFLRHCRGLSRVFGSYANYLTEADVAELEKSISQLHSIHQAKIERKDAFCEAKRTQGCDGVVGLL